MCNKISHDCDISNPGKTVINNLHVYITYYKTSGVVKIMCNKISLDCDMSNPGKTLNKQFTIRRYQPSDAVVVRSRLGLSETSLCKRGHNSSKTTLMVAIYAVWVLLYVTTNLRQVDIFSNYKKGTSQVKGKLQLLKFPCLEGFHQHFRKFG